MDMYIQKTSNETRPFLLVDPEIRLKNSSIVLSSLEVTIINSEGEDVTEAMLEEASVIGANYRTIRFTIKGGEASPPDYNVSVIFIDTDSNVYEYIYTLNVVPSPFAS